MRLHSAPISGNSYRVRLLLGLLGIECEVVNHDTRSGATHTREFLQNVNPAGKIPVLELDSGTMLPESGAIMLYLAEGTSYLPEDKLERARVGISMSPVIGFWLGVSLLEAAVSWENAAAASSSVGG